MNTKIRIPDDMVSGTTHPTKSYGNLEIIEYEGYKEVRVRFLLTCSETTTRADHIRKGSVKDCYKPRIAGIGYVGVGEYPTSSKSKGGANRCYKLWNSMLQRCYNPKDNNYPSYGAKGVTVDPYFHCYQNYADFLLNNGYFDGCQVDKDIKCRELAIYPPVYAKKTLSFVTQEQNRREVNM